MRHSLTGTPLLGQRCVGAYSLILPVPPLSFRTERFSSKVKDAIVQLQLVLAACEEEREEVRRDGPPLPRPCIAHV